MTAVVRTADMGVTGFRFPSRAVLSAPTSRLHRGIRAEDLPPKPPGVVRPVGVMGSFGFGSAKEETEK
jgi:hypothetical protein